MVKKKSDQKKKSHGFCRRLGPHRWVPGTKRGLKFLTPRYDSHPKKIWKPWQKQVDMKNYFQEGFFGTITIQVYYIYIHECVIYIYYIYIYICINRYTPISKYMCIYRWMQRLNLKSPQVVYTLSFFKGIQPTSKFAWKSAGSKIWKWRPIPGWHKFGAETTILGLIRALEIIFYNKKRPFRFMILWAAIHPKKFRGHILWIIHSHHHWALPCRRSRCCLKFRHLKRCAPPHWK